MRVGWNRTRMIGIGDLPLAGGPNATARLAAFCATLFLGALLFFASQAYGALYIGTTSIARASLDGSLFEQKFIDTDGGGICAIAADSSHVYWADGHDHTIGRANLDGTAVENDFITLADQTHPCGLALDSEYLYWPNLGTDTIGRAQLDGSEIDESFILTVPNPCAIAVNETGIYWASETEDEIWRTDIEGVNGPEIVIDENATDSCGLALVGSHLFWVESDAGTVGRANLDGSEPLPTFIAGGHYPVSLVAHEGHLYWINADWDFASVGRADLDGTNVNQAFIGGLEHPYALAADSVQVAHRPAAPPQLSSAFKLGKIRRLQDGSVLFPVDLRGDGWLEAKARGAMVTIRPEGVNGRAMLGKGRKWLKVTPTVKRGNGSRCVLRAFRRGERVRLVLRMRFTEPGKAPLERSRSFFLFKPRQRVVIKPKAKARPVRCHA